MPSIKQTLASNLKRLLAEKGMSQRELAERLNVTVQTVSGLTNAKAGVSGNILSKLAFILKVEETDLVAVPGEKAEPKLFNLMPFEIMTKLSHLSEGDRESLLEIWQAQLDAIIEVPRSKKAQN